jgi:hypothetical protein
MNENSKSCDDSDKKYEDIVYELLYSKSCKKLNISSMYSMLEDPFSLQPWHERIGSIAELKNKEIIKVNDYFEAGKKAKSGYPNLAEEWDYALECIDDLYEPFFGALITMIWIAIERYLNDCLTLFYEDKTDNIRNITATYNKYGLALHKISGYEVINAVRCLNNSFKHNDNIYKTDNFPIDEALCRKWGIKENVQINFYSLPFEEIISRSCEFTKALKEITYKRTLELIDD